MTRIRFWFLGFRAGFWERRPLPYAAYTTTDPVNAAYYRGYALGANISRSINRG